MKIRMRIYTHANDWTYLNEFTKEGLIWQYFYKKCSRNDYENTTRKLI